MTSFHPYSQDVRVVSDLSRFEYATPTPRNRSRNATPTSIDDHDSIQESMESFVKHPRSTSGNLNRQPTMLEIAERADPLRESGEDAKAAFYSTYMDDSTDRLTDDFQSSSRYTASHAGGAAPPPVTTPLGAAPTAHVTPTINQSRGSFAPYPESVSTHIPQQHQHSIPSPTTISQPTFPVDARSTQSRSQSRYSAPVSGGGGGGPPPPPLPKDPKYEANRNSHYTTNTAVNSVPGGDLYPMLTPKDLALSQPPMKQADVAAADEQSINSRIRGLESKLIKSVMNRPLVALPARKFTGFNTYEDKEVVISFTFILYIFEMIFSVAMIVLSGILLSDDLEVSSGIYRYFITSASVTLFVSFLFVFNIIDYEKRNGSFYCTLAFLFELAAFIIVVSTVLPNNHCPSPHVCKIRKAMTAFIILSLFIWFSNLVMFLTTLYISKLNLLGDINFDFSDRGISQHYVKEFPLPEENLAWQEQQMMLQQEQALVKEQQQTKLEIERQKSIALQQDLELQRQQTMQSQRRLDQEYEKERRRSLSIPPVPKQVGIHMNKFGQYLDPRNGEVLDELCFLNGKQFALENRYDVRDFKMSIVYVRDTEVV